MCLCGSWHRGGKAGADLLSGFSYAGTWLLSCCCFLCVLAKTRAAAALEVAAVPLAVRYLQSSKLQISISLLHAHCWWRACQAAADCCGSNTTRFKPLPPCACGLCHQVNFKQHSPSIAQNLAHPYTVQCVMQPYVKERRCAGNCSCKLLDSNRAACSTQPNMHMPTAWHPAGINGRCWQQESLAQQSTAAAL